ARKRVTAAEVAAELEVSERTARRDLEALSMAGVPVYSRQGRNGGWQLVGGAKTDLSGLNAAEARALFLVAGTASSTPEVKTALRKLVRALPEPFRVGAEAASNAMVIDPTAWGRPSSTAVTPAYLEILQQAVVEGEQVTLGYVAPNKPPTTRVVHPLGLATKGPVWYLVADTEAGLRTFRVDRVTDAVPNGVPVARPDGFDLEEAWRLITDTVDARWQSGAEARGAATPETVQLLRMVFGTRVRIGPTRTDGRVDVEVGGSSDVALAGELAGFGARFEILEPPAIRELLHQIGRELTEIYNGNRRLD
ncbi:MAG: helix-turn-helix transcriptional regulator, partial [Acidimicrobiia bacterium]